MNGHQVRVHFPFYLGTNVGISPQCRSNLHHHAVHARLEQEEGTVGERSMTACVQAHFPQLDLKAMIDMSVQLLPTRNSRDGCTRMM